MKEILPSLITVVSALITVTIGAYWALKNIKTNNVINARINWLTQLKEYVSDFISKQFTLLRLTEEISVLAKAQHNPNPDQLSELNKIIMNKFDRYHDLQNELGKVEALIILNLNSNERMHERLIVSLRQSQEIRKNILHTMEQIDQITKTIPPTGTVPEKVSEKVKGLSEELRSDRLKFTENMDLIVDIAKTIFKLEWEKCKRGVVTYWKKSHLRNLEFDRYIKSIG